MKSTSISTITDMAKSIKAKYLEEESNKLVVEHKEICIKETGYITEKFLDSELDVTPETIYSTFLEVKNFYKREDRAERLNSTKQIEILLLLDKLQFTGLIYYANKHSLEKEENLVEQFYNSVYVNLNNIFYEKNLRYGNSFERSLDDFGLIALVIRLSDKLNRFETLTGSDITETEDESLEDTILDYVNYIIMAKMWIKKQRKLGVGIW